MTKEEILSRAIEGSGSEGSGSGWRKYKQGHNLTWTSICDLLVDEIKRLRLELEKAKEGELND